MKEHHLPGTVVPTAVAAGRDHPPRDNLLRHANWMMELVFAIQPLVGYLDTH